MFQRDYFMRMIEQMTEAVGQIMNLRRERKHEEALLYIDELLDTKFRLSSKLIRSLSDEDLLKMMTTNGILETDHLQAIALLMKQEAELTADLGREDESFIAYVKSLHLFLRLSLVDAAPTITEPREQIKELLERLKPYELPLATKRLLMEWLEAEGRYDAVENMMHELLEDNALTNEEADAAYRRLLLQPDERLDAGGLPREEIEQGIEDLAKQQTDDIA
ncbi:hypothetical protein BK120_21985 [Paenibacillus sp. FSL A5-0031]|uniref:DUF6483 family protein n=1 Tax=Paenibacillus sp. FSL A5-0031 TaxID=1920420 RepID=UPI00096D384B|nr:DUF6483 family protein [Paenibacillus sp. FSL A5-0031]OME78983.1 hypothetical protein BK120_21985 [Paenibacillus sp. FSL A5-0031]